MAFRAVRDLACGIVRNLKMGFLYIFGKIKVYRWPMFIVYDPRGYDIKAVDIRKAMGLVKQGDILVRRYRNYLDGYFIPGRFSHSGVYVGDGIIIHAMSGGVQKIDIIDFLRCDGFAILRPSEKDGRDVGALTSKAAKIAEMYLGNDYDYEFEVEKPDPKHKEKVYCHELTRKCYPDLDIPLETASLWNGLIKIRSKKYLAQSFFDSPDIGIVYDSDFSGPKCLAK